VAHPDPVRRLQRRGDQASVAPLRFRLQAQQADALVGGARRELAKGLDCDACPQVRLEDGPEQGVVTCPSGLTARLGISKGRQVPVVDAGAHQVQAERRLGETRAARVGNRAHVRDDADPGLRERREEIRDRSPLITDGEDHVPHRAHATRRFRKGPERGRASGRLPRGAATGVTQLRNEVPCPSP